MINIVVCVKQVLDPEAPVSAFGIDPEVKRAIPIRGAPPVLNPDDENALEAALMIKDLQKSEVKVTVLSMGRSLAKAVITKSLAAGADELYLLEDDFFDSFDSYLTSYILSTAINKMGACDLILTGGMAADTCAGQVGVGIAEILGIPSVTSARNVEVVNGKVKVEQIQPDGYQVIEVPMPALITVSSKLGDLRSVSMQGILAAKNKPITRWTSTDLGTDLAQLERSKITKMFIPVRKEVACQIIEGESPEDAGAKLAVKLRDAELI